ncbi:hypothetical protein Q0601_17730 [Paracoccus onubensis]|uniref:hypothetical protein n=1 Tax=Paracoccus onubensis TaxID=1675788 RepID=UPI00272EEB01|nr:hypothetical protein [Paracoccus onubensis]MDP0929029.1 hypothetical protein [Paracoccus onubensis]
MNSPKIRTQPDTRLRQMSHANPFEGRGRNPAAARRAHIHHHPDRVDFLRRWSLLMIASFPNRETCAVHFGVTFQTACNWFDGFNAPYGQHVDYAIETLPRYAETMRKR